MNENNINCNIETGAEEVKTSVYSSKFLLDKDLFYEFCSVSYHRIKKVFLFFLCFNAFEIIANILVGNYDFVVTIGLSMPFLMLLMYFMTKRVIKVSYERRLILEGKESILNYELFEDKFVSNADERKREFFYHQITSLFETKNFLLLHLRHNLHIIINKNNLNASADEVKAFLLKKCTLVKKKKFIDCSNDKKWSLILLIAIITISVLGTVVGPCLPLMHNKPIHFKGLDYSTTRDDIEMLYGEPDEVKEFIYPQGEFYDVYEAEFLGIKGELLFTYFNDSDNLFMARFIIDSNDFESYKEYEKAVTKTYRYFNKVLSQHERRNISDGDGISVSWARNEDMYAYSMYDTQRSELGISVDPRDCTVFQFNKYLTKNN